MATNNSKHAIDDRITAISQYFIPPLGLTGALSWVSTISSHVTTKSSLILFMYTQTFTHW